jgi:hypothetical protein
MDINTELLLDLKKTEIDKKKVLNEQLKIIDHFFYRDLLRHKCFFFIHANENILPVEHQIQKDYLIRLLDAEKCLGEKLKSHQKALAKIIQYGELKNETFLFTGRNSCYEVPTQKFFKYIK